MLLISLICHTPIVIRGYPCALWPFLTIWRWKTSNETGFGMSPLCYRRKCSPKGGIQWLLVYLLYWVMHVVLYRRIVMAIETAIFVGVFVDCCLFACCPGWRWGNTEQVVAQCQHPVASGVALNMPHWAMSSVLLRRTAVAIKTADGRGEFVRHRRFCHQQ